MLIKFIKTYKVNNSNLNQMKNPQKITIKLILKVLYFKINLSINFKKKINIILYLKLDYQLKMNKV